MGKILSLFTVLLLSAALTFAQDRVVTGKVTDDAGNGIPAASVIVKGSKVGVKANDDGNFSIKVKDGQSLVFSAAGFDAQTVSVTGNSAYAKLVRNNTELTTVVVGALGIKRKAEEVGYAATSLKGEAALNGRQFNAAQALSGKVAGLQISNTSASVNATPRITLRGLRSISGDNTAIVVLDGVSVPANTLNYLNPNDIERYDILKGGQAATLFGSEGVNGAIVITTKRGNQKPEINFTNTYNAEMVAYLPKTQDQFGSGSAYGSSRDENFHPAENQQFGPAYDGSLRPLGRSLADGSYQLLPYSHIDGIRKKNWNTSYTRQTDLSYRAGDANSSFYLSYQNLNSNGIVPKDKYGRNSFRLNASKGYGKVNVGFDATYAWDKADKTTTDFYFLTLNTASWVPLDQYKDWRNNKFADPSGYYNDYYNNPWWSLDNQRQIAKNNYFNANVKVDYKASKSLSFTARIAIANTNANVTSNNNNYTYNPFSKSAAFVQNWSNSTDRALTGLGRSVARTPITGGIGESNTLGNRITADLFAVYNKNFGNVSFKAIVGGQGSSRTSKAFATSTGGIGFDGLYSLGNSSSGLFSSSNSLSEQRKIGGYGDVTLGYKGFIYLHGAYRTDYTSLFYNKDAGFDKPYFSTYGGDISFILSDVVSLKAAKIDNLKIRASYNRNGNDNLGPYSLQQTYPNGTGFPYIGLPGVPSLLGSTKGNLLVTPGLTPEIVNSAEIGVEMGLFKNRLTVEANYYHQKSTKQILTIDIDPASGWTSQLLNAADLTNQGYEFDVKAIAFKNRNWTVNLNANYSHTTNIVDALNGGANNFQLLNDGLTSVNATVGQQFPYMKVTAYKRDALGRVIINSADGWPEREDAQQGRGTTSPIHNLGLGFNVSYKNFTLAAAAEYRSGHLIYNDIGTDMTFTGSGAMTTIYGREQFIWPNSVYDDGTGKLVPNTNIAVDQYKSIYQGFGDNGFSRGFAGTGEMFVSSAAFWKLRDVSLTYDFSRTTLRNVRALKGVSISIWGRNLITLLPNDNWYTDPEFSITNGNAQGYNNTLNTPPTRQAGATLKITL